VASKTPDRRQALTAPIDHVFQPVIAPKVTAVNLRKYLYCSTLIGVFSNLLAIHVGFSIRVFDLLMLVNLPLILLFIDFSRIAAWVIWLILYLTASGSIGVITGTDSISQFAKEFIGITVNLLYFYYFFKLIRNDFERAFLTYVKVSYWFALIAFPLWAYSCVTAHGFERLHGLALEPAAFCELLLPAYYWYARSYFTSRKHGTQASVFTLAIILTGSSLGYISVAFGVLLLLSGRMKHFIAVPVVVGGLLSVAYASSADFRMRVDDTLLAATTHDVSATNLSTYALISNAFVTQQVLKESPLLGNGLGSHPISHARFIGNIPGADAFIDRGIGDFNAPDAGSLTLRVLSELGLLGYVGVLFFIFHFRVGGRSHYATISNAILVSFFLKLVRGGIYFSPEQFFFIFIYLLNHRQFGRWSKTAVRHSASKTVITPVPRLQTPARCLVSNNLEKA
jgi:hypothetical protein